MKKSASLTVLISLCILGMSYGSDEYPEWIPKDAFEAASRLWMAFNMERDDESIKGQYGLSGRYDIALCELRYGYQIVTVDYDEYKEGNNVYDYFDKTLRGRCQYAYGFAVYYNDIHIGEIKVIFVDGYWKLSGTRGFGVLNNNDWFGEMVSAYPSSLGYHLYKEDWGVFFAVKGDSVVTAFTKYEKDKGLIGSDPAEYLLQEKERREKAKLMRGELDEGR